MYISTMLDEIEGYIHNEQIQLFYDLNEILVIRKVKKYS